MKIPKIFIYSLLLTLGVFPSLMNSADIYVNARGNGKIIKSLNRNIITSNLDLNSTIFVIQSKEKYVNPSIYSSCSNNQKLVNTEIVSGKYLYFIYFRFLNSCTDSSVYIKNGDEFYTNTEFKINQLSYEKLFVDFSDFSDSGIDKELSIIDIETLKLEGELGDLQNKTDTKSKFEIIQNLYNKRYADFKNILLSNIQSSRKTLKYISPVNGKVIPTRKGIVPNAARPYRAKYTDGIHHGWDIFASHYTPVRALADGVIIRIKNSFSWSDFDKILWKDISSDDRMTNLDIYRGNQIWLKTADGNVTFYSHLENIPTNIAEGQFIKAKTFLGQVGRSGVPDKEYSDFHLHFEIQVNPHTKTNNDNMDIMRWDYFGEGKNYDTLILEQTKLFSY
ncbi:MAG: M23 family metallopeptidase [Candidatus Gracilibacteria bacterium]|nr:M23 family metallopeptidase [Candidatus Gracilibacteria bacterium]MDD2909016.1 M23 family metallopeptidase [Candidatus Gracilibacteria bacterium]